MDSHHPFTSQPTFTGGPDRLPSRLGREPFYGPSPVGFGGCISWTPHTAIPQGRVTPGCITNFGFGNWQTVGRSSSRNIFALAFVLTYSSGSRGHLP
jgi:hypothetical protein